jgi:hypothetical protein
MMCSGWEALQSLCEQPVTGPIDASCKSDGALLLEICVPTLAYA